MTIRGMLTMAVTALALAGCGGGGDQHYRHHGGDWEPLGCQDVTMRFDRDTIHVGREEGRFRAIGLEVFGTDIEVRDVTVIYANGEPDHIPVRSYLRRGARVGPYDLRGERRAISRVELAYRALPDYRGSARVCVSGLR